MSIAGITKSNIYGLSHFLKIKDDGFDYTIEAGVLAMINSLANEVGAPTYIRTPQFNKSQLDYQKKRRNKNPPQISNEDWEAIRNFQATRRIEKEGIEKQISTIREALNKITDKNYESQQPIIMETLDEISKNPAFTEVENFNVSKAVFDIASSNKFYSSVYAKLFKDIINNFEIMNTIFIEKFDTFIALFQEIEACDPNDDYNKFCAINKDNENRRALSMFFVNLMKKNIVTPDAIINIIITLQTSLKNMLDQENKTSEINEITENLFIFITNSHKELSAQSEWGNIVGYVNEISNMNIKSFKSLTNKSVFKHLDILDEIN